MQTAFPDNSETPPIIDLGLSNDKTKWCHLYHFRELKNTILGLTLIHKKLVLGPNFTITRHEMKYKEEI